MANLSKNQSVELYCETWNTIPPKDIPTSGVMIIVAWSPGLKHICQTKGLAKTIIRPAGLFRFLVIIGPFSLPVAHNMLQHSPKQSTLRPCSPFLTFSEDQVPFRRGMPVPPYHPRHYGVWLLCVCLAAHPGASSYSQWWGWTGDLRGRLTDWYLHSILRAPTQSLISYISETRPDTHGMQTTHAHIYIWNLSVACLFFPPIIPEHLDANKRTNTTCSQDIPRFNRLTGFT